MPPRPRQHRFESRLADPHDHCRLALRQILEMEEQYRRSLSRREKRDRFADGKQCFALDERGVRKQCLVGDFVESAVVDEVPPAAKHVDGAIVADPVEPRADTRIRRPVAGILPEADQRVLHGIFGLFEAPEHAVREAQQARSLAVDQTLERSGIARRDCADLLPFCCCRLLHLLATRCPAESTVERPCLIRA